MGKTDAELMLEFKFTGREEPFAELVRRHKRRLLNYFYRLTWDRQASEDCCQEVFCRVFRSREDYVPTASFATYLYRIGRNLWIDRYRSRKRRPSAVSLDKEVGDGGAALGDLIAGEAQEPSRGPEIRDEFNRVRRALDELSPELKETLVLVKYQGLKYAEAADALGVPIGTVRSRIHAAVRQVRAELDAGPETVRSESEEDE
jgi:RNA polymerase sigma-70 factor (ECF subfamily)